MAAKRRASPILIRFNYDAPTKFEVAESIGGRLITFYC